MLLGPLVRQFVGKAQDAIDAAAGEDAFLDHGLVLGALDPGMTAMHWGVVMTAPALARQWAKRVKSLSDAPPDFPRRRMTKQAACTVLIRFALRIALARYTRCHTHALRCDPSIQPLVFTPSHP